MVYSRNSTPAPVMSNAACNCTAIMLFQGFTGLCGSFELWILFGVTAFLFLVSLLGNIVFCYRRSKKNHGGSLPRHGRTSVKTPAETPVYGNLSFLQLSEDLLKSEEAAGLETPPQRLPDQKMCYANLNVTTPAVAEKANDPGVQYAEVVTLSKGKSNPESQEKDAGQQKRASMGAVMLGDPLYASVQTDRYRTRFEDRDYANNS